VAYWGHKEEGKATLGGVNVQEIKWSGKERVSEGIRILVGTVLFVLTVGIWVYLWVPPPGF
jgi:type II secretory pathway component PulM